MLTTTPGSQKKRMNAAEVIILYLIHFNSPCGVVYAMVTELLTLSCSAVCVASTTILYRVFGCSAEMLWDSCDVVGTMTW